MTDFGHQRIVDRLLAHIEKNGENERLRKLAADVRRGNASLGDYLNSAEYAQALQPGMADFTGWYDQLSDSERAEQAQRLQKAVDQVNQMDADDPDPRMH